MNIKFDGRRGQRKAAERESIVTQTRDRCQIKKDRNRVFKTRSQT